MRRVELPGPRAPVAPVLHEIAFPGELHHSGISVPVGDVGAPVRPDGRVRRLVEAGRTRNRALDPVGHIHPRFQTPAERLDDSPFGRELHHDVVPRIHQPHVVLGIESHAVGCVEDRRALAHRRDERPVRPELQQRVIAPVQQEDVPLRIERDADRFRWPDVFGKLEEILLDVKRKLRRRRPGRRHGPGAAAALTREGNRDGHQEQCRHQPTLHHLLLRSLEAGFPFSTYAGARIHPSKGAWARCVLKAACRRLPRARSRQSLCRACWACR